MKWEIYKRSIIPVHRVTPYLYGVQKYTHKFLDCEPVRCVYTHEGEKIWWGWDYYQIREIGKKLIDDIRNDYNGHFELSHKLLKKALEHAERVRKTDLRSLSDDDLIELYENHLKEIIECHAFLGVTVDAIDIYPYEYFKEIVFDFLPEEANKEEVFNELNKPTFLSYLKEEEKDLMEKDLDYMEEKWWWVSLGWETMKPMTKEDFIKQKEELKEFDFSFVEKNKKRKEELIKKYKFNEEILFFIRLFDDYSKLHDMRKEMQVKTVYGLYLLMKEAERRLKVEGLEYYLSDEVVEFLKGKDITDHEERKKASLVYIYDTKIEKYSGDKAIEKRHELFDVNESGISEVIGMGSFPGKVTGKAKVCFGIRDALEKVEEGDILICSMTLPDYVPAIKKAAAIVTDEGGITCHAAIISREMKKPCVIGTRNATDVFKDDELIEVDAMNGIVRKI